MLELKLGGVFLEIGNFIRKLRNDKGYTLKELASLTDMSYSYLSQIETGNRGASPEILRNHPFKPQNFYAYVLSCIGYADDRALIEGTQSRLIQTLSEIEQNTIHLLQLNDKFKNEEDPDKLAEVKKYFDEVSQLQIKLRTYEAQLRNKLEELGVMPRYYPDDLEDFRDLKAGPGLMQQAEDNYNNNIGTHVYLNENNEGDFYFFKDNKSGSKILDDDIQDKIRTLIKTLLD